MENLWTFLTRNSIRWTQINRLSLKEDKYSITLLSGASFGWEGGRPCDIFAGDSGFQALQLDRAWRQNDQLLYHPTPEAEAILGIPS